MRAKSVVGWLALMIAVAAGMRFLTARTAIARTQAALAAVALRQASIDAETKRLEKSLAAIERKNRERLSTHGQPPPLAEGQNPPIRPPNPRLDALIKNPKLQVAYLAARRASLGGIYGPLFRELNLSADQIGQFKDLAMRREAQRLDIAGADPATMQAAHFLIDASGRPEFSVGGPDSRGTSDGESEAATPLLEQADRDFQSDEVGLLGANGYQQAEHYERTLPVRGMVDNLIAQLSTSSDPVSPGAADQLAQILAQASSSFQAGQPASIYNVDWDKALAQAVSVLSPVQYQALVTATTPQKYQRIIVSVLEETNPAVDKSPPAR